jgi:hypothetical protein
MQKHAKGKSATGYTRRKVVFLKKWSGRQDSNLRPSGPKPDALPGCATPRHGITGITMSSRLATCHLRHAKVVGPEGLEPPT